MWVKKSAGEIRKEERLNFNQHFNPIAPLAFGFIISIIFTFMSLLGWRSRSQIWSDPKPLSEWPSAIIEGLPSIGFVFLVVTAAAFIVQSFRGSLFTGRSGDTLICTSCFQPRSAADGNKCKCGGHCEPLEKWKWIDDPHS